jgi:hypothetical protein
MIYDIIAEYFCQVLKPTSMHCGPSSHDRNDFTPFFIALYKKVLLSCSAAGRDINGGRMCSLSSPV